MSRHRILRSELAVRWLEFGSRRVGPYLPPGMIRALKRLSSEWEYRPGGWSSNHQDIKGWDDPSVAATQEAHWPVLLRNLAGSGPLGVSHFPWSQTREDRGDHNTMMSFGYVLARAAHKRDRLSVLDWGGSAGHYYLYSRALMPEVAVEYHCVELSCLSRLGRRLQPEVHFHEVATEATARRYDLVLSSSSLHYFQDWRAQLKELASVTAEFLYIARLQTVERVPSFTVVQRPYRYGYDTEYLSWFLNRGELLDCCHQVGLELVREFVFSEEWCIRNAPETGESRGFLLRHRENKQ